MSAPHPELSRIVLLGSLPARGRDMQVTATPAECQALAARFDMPAIESLAASLRLAPLGDGRVRLTGRLHARVVQVCVVALEPFAQDVDAPLAVTFVPRALEPEETEGGIDLDADDEEPYDGERLEVGEVIAQALSLSLDPWPRNPGSDLPSGAGADADSPPAPSPFAVLARRRR